MPVVIRDRIFAPALPETLLTVVALAGLVGLGVWQLQRASEKRALMSTFVAGQEQTVKLSRLNAEDLPRYQQVIVTGEFEPSRQLLLDNMPSRTGVPGYRVLTPLKLEDGGMLLVDRGWVALGPTRAALPAIEVSSDRREIFGRLDRLPLPAMRLGTLNLSTPTWPLVLNFPEYPDLKGVYGDGLLRPILLLDAQAEDGFERAWEPHFGVGPMRNLGYAIQWFALALALAVIFVVVNLKKTAVNTRALS
jgi:surfeit locus 1 family protein